AFPIFKAIEEVHTSGTFDPDFLHQNLAKAKMEEDTIQAILADLKDKEIQLLKLCCTELTYKEIADRMLVSPKTVDGYRDSLFIKLGVKSRIGIAMFALKNQMVYILREKFIFQPFHSFRCATLKTVF